MALLSPKGIIITHGFQLQFECTNIAEFEGLVLGARMTQILGAEYLEVTSDSLMAINQANQSYHCKAPRLITYRDHATHLLFQFKGVKYTHVLRRRNILAGSLASLASSLRFPLSLDHVVVQFQILIEPLIFSREPWL